MDIRNCCSSDSRSIQLGRCGGASGKKKWRMLWMKFKKEKKRLLQSSATSLHTPYYDPRTYSQNFDQGTALDESDNLSRSFSARFADPSRLNLKKVVV